MRRGSACRVALTRGADACHPRGRGEPGPAPSGNGRRQEAQGDGVMKAECAGGGQGLGAEGGAWTHLSVSWRWQAATGLLKCVKEGGWLVVGCQGRRFDAGERAEKGGSRRSAGVTRTWRGGAAGGGAACAVSAAAA